jgi:flagellar hook assembly protein FlgD
VALSGTGRAALSSAYVLLAENKIQIKGQKPSTGNIHSNNEILFETGNPSTHTGNLTSVGKTTIKRNNTIKGNVKASGQLVVENNVTITGTASGYTAVARVALPKLSFSAGGKNVTVGKHKSPSLAPGYYGDVKVENDATLFLQNGEYFFKSFDVKDRAVLAIDVTNGPVKINVVATLHFRNSAEMTITPYGDNGSRWVTFNGMGDVTVEDNCRILAAIIAPAKRVNLNKNVFFKGSISAREIIVGEYVTFLYHTSNSTVPKENADGDETVENVEQPVMVTQYELAQNYPNPFNPSTTIRFSIPTAEQTTLQIYDLRGALVKTLVLGMLAAGRHQIVWDGRNANGQPVASGMYLYRIQAGSFVQMKRMLLVR